MKKVERSEHSSTPAVDQALVRRTISAVKSLRQESDARMGKVSKPWRTVLSARIHKRASIRVGLYGSKSAQKSYKRTGFCDSRQSLLSQTFTHNYSSVARSIAQVTRYFAAFYSNSLQTAPHVQHYIKETSIIAETFCSRSSCLMSSSVMYFEHLTSSE